MIASIPYLQDKLIWCVQPAGEIPRWLNFFLIMPLWMWIFILLDSVLLCSILIYLLVPFDKYYRGKSHRIDFFYCLLLVMIPSYTWASSILRPSSTRFRILYFMLLTCAIFFHQLIGVFLYQFMHHQFHYHQIATSNEIVEENFRLTGEIEVLNAIKHNELV